MLNTLVKDTLSEKNSILSNSSAQLKLIRRTSRSKSLKIKRSECESSLDQSFPTYFVKKVPKFNSKNNEEELETTDVTPVKMIKRKSEQETLTEKKRQPTPVKSYRQMTENSKTYKKLNVSDLNMQKEMQIHDLTKKLQSQTKIRIMFQQRAKQFQNEVSIQAKKVKSLQKQLDIAKQKQTLLKQKITDLEGQVDSKNHDLKNTKSNLQKLKENIKEVRNQQYQSEVRKVNEQIYKYKSLSEQQYNQMNSLKNQNTALKMQIAHIKTISEQNKLKVQQESKQIGLIREIQTLKVRLNASSTQKQRFLQQKIMDLQKQIQALKNINQSKLIEIDFLNRKKHQELQNLRKRKCQQIKSLRIKFAALMDEYKHLKQKKNQTKSKQRKDLRNKSVEKNTIQKRQNRFACPSKERSEDDLLCFSLSPDFK